MQILAYIFGHQNKTSDDDDETFYRVLCENVYVGRSPYGARNVLCGRGETCGPCGNRGGHLS